MVVPLRACGVWVAALVGCAVGVTHEASADDAAAPKTTMTCERLAQPGRMKCDVEARATTGSAIRWGDVEVVKVPAFTTVLRGRIGPREATTREDDVWRWAFALVAREAGAGEVEAKVRVVECVGPGAGRCAPREVKVVGRAQVGE
jgi:hypothetical protein